MTFASFEMRNLSPLYDCLKILDVRKTFQLETGKHMFKHKNGILPLPIGNYFSLTSEVETARSQGLRRRTGKTPSIICRLTSTGQKSIQSRGEKLWHDIQTPIRNSKSLNSFKNLFKSELLER